MKSWDYKDENGRLLGRVKRIDESNGKRFVQYKPNGKPGGFGHPLYGLQRLTDRNRSVHIFEGEKCADAGYACDLISISTCGGAAAGHLANVEPLDGFKLVVIHPDNDKPSKQRWTPALIKKLAGLKIPPRVMVCELPDLPEKGDIVDWIQARVPTWDGFDLGNAPEPLKEQLRETIKATVVPSDKWTASNHGIEVIEGGWSEPEELPSIVSPVPAFDPNLLPLKLQEWARHGAANINCPIDYIAVAAMVEAGSILGRKVTVHPKQFESWCVVPNLWGAIIGPPSMKKSPAIKYALRPIRRLQKNAMEQHAQDMAQYHRDMILLSGQIEQARQELKNALKKHDTEEGRRLADEIAELQEKAQEPSPRQYYTSDATIEKLAILLQENPNGLLQERDELMGWLRGMDRQGREQDRPFYLETWEGDGSYTVHRMSRDSVHCNGMALSVFGGIQPGPTSEYVADSLRGGVRDDGMLQRFQLAVWPDPINEYTYTDRLQDSTVYAAAESVYTHLDELTAERVGAEVIEDGLPFLRFDDAAQAMFIDWITTLNTEKLRGDIHPAMQSHLSKYESLMPSLALILHLADGYTGPIGVQSAARAADWCEYLEGHARRIYGSNTQEEARTARLLADKVLAGKVEDGWPTWKVFKAGWSGLDKKSTESALTTLDQYNWLKVERVPTGGRSKQVIRLNPLLEVRTIS